MKLDFEVGTDEGPVKFVGELSVEEVKVLLEFAFITMLQRGYLPADADKVARMTPGDPSTVQ